MRYNKEKRIFLVKKFSQLNNANLVQTAWRSKYKGERAPARGTVLNTVRRFENTSSVAPLSSQSNGTKQKRKEAKNQFRKFVFKRPISFN